MWGLTAQESDSFQVSGAAAYSLWKPISLQTILSKTPLTEWSWRSSLVMLVYWNNLSCQSCEPVWLVCCQLPNSYLMDMWVRLRRLWRGRCDDGKKSLNDSFLETTRGLILTFIHAALDVAVIRGCWDALILKNKGKASLTSFQRIMYYLLR